MLRAHLPCMDSLDGKRNGWAEERGNREGTPPVPQQRPQRSGSLIGIDSSKPHLESANLRFCLVSARNFSVFCFFLRRLSVISLKLGGVIAF